MKNKKWEIYFKEGGAKWRTSIDAPDRITAISAFTKKFRKSWIEDIREV